VDFGKLFAETSEQKFSLKGVQYKKICSHQGGNSIKSMLRVIYAGVSQSNGRKGRVDWRLRKGDGLGNKRK